MTTVGVTHTNTTALTNNAAYDVSSTTWNLAHTTYLLNIYDVIVWLNGSLWEAINTRTQAVISSNATLVTVCTAANAAATTSGKVLVIGARIPGTLSISSTVRFTEVYQGDIREYGSNGMVFRTVFPRTTKYIIADKYADENDKYTLYLLPSTPNDNYGSLLMTEPKLGYGTYEWKATCTGIGTANVGFIFGFELHHGRAGDGLIVFYWDGAIYKTQTKSADVETAHTLSGQDWSIERTFKFAWDATGVTFYIDGAQVGDKHTTNFPTSSNSFFLEIYTSGGAAPATVHFLKARDFKQLA